MPSFVINSDGSVTQTTRFPGTAQPGRLGLLAVLPRVIDPSTNTDSEQLGKGLAIVGRRIESTLVSLGLVRATTPASPPPTPFEETERGRAWLAEVRAYEARLAAIRAYRRANPFTQATYPVPGAQDP